MPSELPVKTRSTFGATGARILSQAVKELSAMPKGAYAIVSICADGGQGTVALLRNG